MTANSKLKMREIEGFCNSLSPSTKKRGNRLDRKPIKHLKFVIKMLMCGSSHFACGDSGVGKNSVSLRAGHWESDDVPVGRTALVCIFFLFLGEGTRVRR